MRRDFLTLLYIPVFVFGIFLGSCSRSEEPMPNLELPPTPILESRARYAVIISSHLRLRSGPSIESKVKETLWKGSVMEVVGKASSRVVVDNQEGYWYQVAYDGLQGYVFGGYLRFFSSKEAAEEAVRSPEF